MEIKNDSLKRMLESAFGINIQQQNILADSNSTSENAPVQNDKVAVYDEGLRFRAGRRWAAEELNKQKNIEDVVGEADKLLQADPETSVTQDDVDKGWVDECLDGAGKAYDEDLKQYWAKLLAGETRAPGTYSLRAVDFMKKLSKKDAERIRSLCKLVMYTHNNDDALILRYDHSSYYKYTDMRYLMELGLIDASSTEVIQLRFNDKDKGNVLYIHGDAAIYLEIDRKGYDLPVYAFTELGKEILSVIDDQAVDFGYLKEFSRSITNGKKDISIIGGRLILKDSDYAIVHDNIFFRYPEIQKEKSPDNIKL